MKTDPSALIPVEEAVAGRRYWLTNAMPDRPMGPSYHGKVLDFSDASVTVEIEVMAAGGGDATAVETWPRRQTQIQEIPDA